MLVEVFMKFAKDEKSWGDGDALFFKCFSIGLVLGLLVFLMGRIDRVDVLDHFRVFMIPTFLFGLVGRFIFQKSNRLVLEKIGRAFMVVAIGCCGGFVGMCIYLVFT